MKKCTHNFESMLIAMRIGDDVIGTRKIDRCTLCRVVEEREVLVPIFLAEEPKMHSHRWQFAELVRGVAAPTQYRFVCDCGKVKIVKEIE